MDKLELCMRWGLNNFTAALTIDDILDAYIIRGDATLIKQMRYRNSRRTSRVVGIPLLPGNRCVLVVETGVAGDRKGNRYPYEKFSFNVSRLSADDDARWRFHEVMIDLIPEGGYPVLLEDGYVLYVEFAADFLGLDSATVDAYCSTLTRSNYFPSGGPVKTINIYDDRHGRPKQFCVYDKRQAEWKRNRRLRRGMCARVEARRRFNRSPTYRLLRLADLQYIPNPFDGLRLYDRELIARTFTADRHRSFLAHAQCEGVQAAIAGTRGADKERRERMLEQYCRMPWWDARQAWAGAQNAVLVALLL